MKRLTAILFLGIMLFNLYGYRLVIDYLQQQHDEHLSVRLDNNKYNDEELISIKTRLSLPYYTNSEEFERVDGTISIEGVYYNYVKRRIYNDSLELLCLPNTVKSKLEKAEMDFSKTAMGGTSTTPKNTKQVPVVKSLLPDFYEDNSIDAAIPGIQPVRVMTASYVFIIPSICLTVLTPPPNSMQFTV